MGEPSRKSRRIAVVAAVVASVALAWTATKRCTPDARRVTSTPVPAGARASAPAGPARGGAVRAASRATPLSPATGSASTRSPAVVVLTARAVADASATSGRLEGLVRSRGDGRPIAGAELVFVHAGATRSVRSGPDGAFLLEPRAPGEHVLAVVTADRFLPFSPALSESRVVFDATPGSVVRGVLIELSPIEAVVVTVRDPDGRPLAGATVQRLDDARGESLLVPPEDRATTDAVGEATVLAPEASVLEASKAGFTSARLAVDLAVRASGRATLQLGRAAAPERFAHDLGGRVVDSRGAPIAGAHVVAAPVPENAALPEARLLVAGGADTASDGRFVVHGLAAERYDLVATDPDTREQARALGVAAGRLDVELRLAPSATLAGTVTEVTTGAPVPAFTVIVTERRSALELHDLARTAVLDASGRFELRGLPPGPAIVTVVASGHAPRGDVEVELAVDRPARVDVQLSAGRAIRGRVTEDGTGRPLADASVSAEGRIATAASIVAVSATTRTDDSGSFVLDGLGDGPRALEVSARGHHTRIVQVVLGAAETPTVEVALRRTEPGETPRIELVGIGAVLAAHGDVLVVGEVVPGAGAAEAGIVPNDEVLSVDGAPVATLGFEGAIGRIRGVEGTTVVLEVRRAGGTSHAVAVPRRRVLAR